LRVLFLSKRQPQQRDLIERPYGRFHHLPTAMAALGHDVTTLLCSHRRMGKQVVVRDGVRWSSHDLLDRGPRRLMADLTDEAEEFRPDWVIGCSDTWFGWLAHVLAQRTGARLAVDAYDNYEAYMRWNWPLHWKWRRSVRAADLVTAAGPQLAELLQTHRRGGRKVEVLPMAADAGFVPMDRAACRGALGLPDAAPLIGYSGGWARNRGTHVLLDGFQRVRDARPDARLVLSGRPPAEVCAAPGVIALGYLDDAQLPVLLNALDVACVITADTLFGRYSYPAKLCEAMACSVPVVATATGPVRWMLDDDARFLAAVGNADDIAAKILSNLGERRVDYGSLPSWQDNGRRLEALLSD
jgi:glycosyltransferase involved in cell wall biosynthesis